MKEIELWMLAPFAMMLSGIAFLPLLLPRMWEKNIVKIIFANILALPTISLLANIGYGSEIKHQMLFDYLPFIILIGALYIVTGGINIKLSFAPTPRNNTAILFIGYLLASIMGTTGAALLLVRPLLSMNKKRVHKAHLMLFLIALVANCGGLLTPLGDPPLFMLFLRGVPFGWFLTLFPVWATIGAILLALYYLADTYYYRKEEKVNVATEANSVTCRGAQNFIYLVAIVLAVAFINTEHIPLMQENGAPLYIMFLREIVLIIIALLSWFTTSSTTRKENSYSWSSFNEIAILFFGIFVTMTPALIYLRSHASEIGIATESGFYYATGLLSSFLDNTPTAITLYTLAMESNVSGVGVMVAGIPESYLAAISLGAVLFGSMTYIGNGPNFMIKSIAEEDGVKMPGFFGYILQFALPVLLPLFIIIQLLFVN